jgi:hypothetical protein
VSFKNKTVALENMVIVRDTLAGRGIPLFLNFGSLLGAVREHNFIPHDHDVDTGIFERDVGEFLEALPEMAEKGLVVCDIWANKRCYSLLRGGEQIDVFVARERRTPFGRQWNIDGKASLPARHFDSLDELEFLGYTFKVPHDPIGVVRNLYGRTWDIPIDGKVSRIDVTARVVAALKSPRTTLAYVPTFVGNRIKWAMAAKRTALSKGPHA